MENWKGRALGSILFESKMISQQDIEQALAEQREPGVRFGEALINLKIVSSEDVNWVSPSNSIFHSCAFIRRRSIRKRCACCPRKWRGGTNCCPTADRRRVDRGDGRPDVQRAVSDVETITGKR
jgi:hypothetical protein